MSAYEKACASIDAMTDDEIVETWNYLMYYQPEKGWSQDKHATGVTMEDWSLCIDSELSSRGLQKNRHASGFII